jgi:lipid-A-disaccharide synthase
VSTHRPTIFLSCGEASAEVYATAIAEQLRSTRPELRLVGVGGDAMRAAGVELWAGRDELSVMGFAEIIGHLPRLWRLRRMLEQRALREGVDLFLPVDYPGFHMSLASRLRRRGIYVLDFIPPKTWSWGSWRNSGLRKAVDRCAVIFPFEQEYYRSHGVDAEFVGHPLLDAFEAKEERDSAGERTLLLVPGSREQELARVGAVLGAAAGSLVQEQPQLRVVVSRAPNVPEAWLAPLLSGCPSATVEPRPLRELFASASAALVTSGTATLEAALSLTPHGIVYRTSALSYALASRLASVEHIGIANIVLGRRAYPELLQGELNEASVLALARQLLGDESFRADQMRSCHELRTRLGEELRGSGAIARVCELALDALDRRQPKGYIAGAH